MLKIFLIWVAFVSTISMAGGRAGNGFAVQCKSDSSLGIQAGYYSLDYLATLGLGKSASVSSWDKSAERIGKIIRRVLPPKWVASYEDFVLNVLNTDYSANRVWEKSPFGVLDLSKAQSLFKGHPGQLRSNLRSLVSHLPGVCTGADGVEFIPAVVFLDHFYTGRPEGTLVYKYVPKVVEELNASDPLQLSYLYIHEWLWDISDSEDRNRRMNHFLHSEGIEELSDAKIIEQLRGMGLPLDKPKTPGTPIPTDPGPGGEFMSLEAEKAYKATLKPQERYLTLAEIWLHKHSTSVPAFQWGDYELSAVERDCSGGQCGRWKVSDLVWSKKLDPNIVNPEYPVPSEPGPVWFRYDGNSYVLIHSPAIEPNPGSKSVVILSCILRSEPAADPPLVCNENWMFGGTVLFGFMKPKGTFAEPKFTGGFYLDTGLWIGWAGKYKDIEIRMAFQSKPIKKVPHHRVRPD